LCTCSEQGRTRPCSRSDVSICRPMHALCRTDMRPCALFFCTIIVAVRLRLPVQTNPLFHCSYTYASFPCDLPAVRITCTYATVTFFLSGTAPTSELLPTFAPREVSPTCAPVHQCGCTVYSRFARWARNRSLASRVQRIISNCC
jgi:hypothetical protein